VAATPVKKPEKVNFFGEKERFSKGYGHGKNHEKHVPVPVPFLAGFQNHVLVPFLGWFPKPVPVARGLGPCPYTPV
jgi:hypothetical protein